MDTTTIQVTIETRDLLASLKRELKASDFNQVIFRLIDEYRQAHGWSALSLAEQLENLELEEP